MLSRVTLAMIDAAAMDKEIESPLTIVCPGQGKAGIRLPSTSAKSGLTGRALPARSIALKVAPRMLNFSISCGVAAPIPILAHEGK